MATACTTVDVDDSAVKELVKPTSAKGRTTNRLGIILCVAETEDKVYLAYKNSRGLDDTNGDILYPGQSLRLTTDSPTWASIINGGIWGICAAGETCTVRIQEL